MIATKTVETPTGQLRFERQGFPVRRILQQQIKVTVYDAGSITEQRIVWRDVPEVDSE